MKYRQASKVIFSAYRRGRWARYKKPTLDRAWKTVMRRWFTASQEAKSR